MSDPSPDWFDAQYNNRARIPEHLELLRAWSDASDVVRRARASWFETAYGPAPRERLDVFPATSPGSPVLVYIHGGYWRALDKRDQSFLAPPFVDAGAMVVLPGYTLCPEVTIEDIVRQVAQALAWVHRHAAEHGGDPARIVVAGHSAGGHLATMLLAHDWTGVAPDLPADLVKAALSISGLYDLEPLRHAPFLAPDLRLTEVSARRLSPASMPPPRGRLVTIVGADESDEFQRQAALISTAWPATTVASEIIPRRHHMNVLDTLIDPASPTHRWALRLLGLDDAAARTARRPRTG